MFKNVNSFYPNHIFPKFNFAKIKKNLIDLNKFSSIEDFGSILIMENDSYYLTVNEIGKIQIYYDSLDIESIIKIIDDIEHTFKEQADTFYIKNKYLKI